MQRGILWLRSVSEAGIVMRGLASGVVLAGRFAVEVGGRQSAEQLALVEQIGEHGVTGHLKIRCVPTAFGIPTQVLDPHIDAYVAHAVHMVGGVRLADMASGRPLECPEIKTPRKRRSNEFALLRV